METVISVLLIVMGIFLVISVLMQNSKDHRISGSIAGGAETFFGKQKGKTLDALFNRLTTIVTIIFVLLVLVLYVLQPSIESLVAEQNKGTGQTEVTGTDGTETNKDAENTGADVTDDADKKAGDADTAKEDAANITAETDNNADNAEAENQDK